ncbi:MAG: 2-amino-4-hydroxy-6-hydroxymethyldihydropteridine diphosphokinase [Legionella sp.]
MNVCYLGLGSNLRVPQRQLRKAVFALRKTPHSRVTKVSTIYFSEPYGMRGQPTYCNMAIELATTLPPIFLLSYCQRIEHEQLRVRKKHWGSRTLDIDILLYADRLINLPNLIVPHPQMLKRDFVLKPLLEIAPNIRHPNGNRLDTYLSQCATHIKSNDS